MYLNSQIIKRKVTNIFEYLWISYKYVNVLNMRKIKRCSFFYIDRGDTQTSDRLGFSDGGSGWGYWVVMVGGVCIVTFVCHPTKVILGWLGGLPTWILYQDHNQPTLVLWPYRNCYHGVKHDQEYEVGWYFNHFVFDISKYMDRQCTTH